MQIDKFDQDQRGETKHLIMQINCIYGYFLGVNEYIIRTP